MPNTIRVDVSKDTAVLENGLVKLSLRREGEIYRQEIYAKDSGEDWQLVLTDTEWNTQSEERVSHPPISQVLVIEQDAHRAVLELGSTLGVHQFRTRVSLQVGVPFLHFDVEDTVAGEIGLEFLENFYRFAHREPDFSFAPNLRPKANQTIGQHTFRSPAVILQKRNCLVALVPDLNLVSDHSDTMPLCLDLEVDPNVTEYPILGYGLKEHDVVGHVYYEHTPEMKRKINNEKLRYGYYLYVDGRAVPRAGYQQISRFLWNTFGTRYLQDIKPQVVDFDTYGQYGFDYALKYLWTEMEIGDFQCGGTVMGREYERDIWFCVWFNNLRTAFAFYHFGQEWNRPDLVDKARRIKNLVLSAPQDRGAFPTIFYQKLQFGRPYHWVPSSKQGGSCDLYHLADCSWTAYWLLRWHEEAEKDPRVVDFCRRFADFVMGVQLSSGAIPAWVDSMTFAPEDRLKESAETGCPGLFLAQMAVTTGASQYLEAARKAAAFVIREVMPKNNWADFECFYSCSPKELDFYDPHTGQFPNNNLCIYWAAKMFRLLYLATGEDPYLEQGRRALDFLSFYQSVWDAPFISIHTFGGFAVQNSDGEWNDARQAVFAPTYLDYYELTGCKEYFERGIAALRASFVTMFIPENREVSVLMDPQPKIPMGYVLSFIGDSDENYAHRGRDERACGTSFDWGTGGALTAAGMIRAKYGDVYIDFGRRKAFGIDGCMAEVLETTEQRISLHIEMKAKRTRPLLIKGGNMKQERYVLTINGSEPQMYTALELSEGIRWLEKE